MSGNYDAWKTRTPDDDPDGEQAERDYSMGCCQDCGAGPNEPCTPTCGCARCRARELDGHDLVAAVTRKGA